MPGIRVGQLATPVERGRQIRLHPAVQQQLLKVAALRVRQKGRRCAQRIGKFLRWNPDRQFIQAAQRALIPAAVADVLQRLLNLFPVQRTGGQFGFRRRRRIFLGRRLGGRLARPNRSAGRHQGEHRDEGKSLGAAARGQGLGL